KKTFKSRIQLVPRNNQPVLADERGESVEQHLIDIAPVVAYQRLQYGLKPYMESQTYVTQPQRSQPALRCFPYLEMITQLSCTVHARRRCNAGGSLAVNESGVIDITHFLASNEYIYQKQRIFAHAQILIPEDTVTHKQLSPYQ